MEKFDPKNIENILALTPMQEGMLFHYLKEPRSGLYVEQLSLQIGGEIDLKLFEDTWNVVIESNEMLRTVFRWEKQEKPSQIILKEHPCNIRFHNLSDMDDDQKQMILAEIKTKDREEGFNLTRVPFRVILCKLTEMQYEMIISNHHILYDGWSNGIILKEFFNVYHSLSKGEQVPKFQLKASFKEYIKWLQSRDRNKQEQFWRNYLADFLTPSELPIKKKIKEAAGTVGYSIIPDDDIKEKLDVFIKKNRVTSASVFYTAWGLLLQRYYGSEDIVFGTTVSGRSADIRGIEDVVGLFINTIPLRVRAYPGEKIIDAVSRTDQLLREREEFEHTPLVDIGATGGIGGMGGRDVARNVSTLFDTIVAIENYPLDDFVYGSHNLSPENNLISVHSYSITEMTHYDLTVGIMPFNEIEIKFSFKQELFENDAIENLAGHFKRIIQTIIDSPETALSQLEIISIEEKSRILNEFNDTAAAYPADKTIHQLFAEQVERTPDHIALVGADPRVCPALSTLSVRLVRPVGPVSLSYRKLNEQSDRLAGLLIEKGVLPDTIVGIMMERSVEMVIGIMGILKSGGAYLPIDPECPQERIDYMLRDGNAKLLVTTNDKEGEKVSCRDVARNVSTKFLPSYLLNSSNLAYVIYTSGSTGRPKGVAVEHRQVVNFVYHMFSRYDGTVGCDDRCLSLTNIMFDVSVWEFFLPLSFGTRIVFMPDEKKFDVFALARIILDAGITLIYLPPGLLKPVYEQLKKQYSAVRINKMLVGVEPIRDEVLEYYMRLNPAMKIINGYGPTETTICATSYNYLSHKPTGEIVPIGVPLANTRVILSDAFGSIVPLGIPGEICISGDGVSRGYLNNPELTNDRFIFTRGTFEKAPLNPPKLLIINHLPLTTHHSPIYKTGDLARWLNDGNIEFLGRIDHQVKIRGFRIEPGEIENRLLKHEQIKQAVVLAKEDSARDKHLAAYFVSDYEIAEAELREYLAKDLPDYMIPSYFMRLEKMPLNPSGKVDRKRLPQPELKARETYVAPRDEIEKKLLEIWTDILDKNLLKYRVGIDDNFFRLGGHSLKATILALKVHKTFQVNLPLAEIFRTPTIRGLANYITTAVKARYVSIEPVEKKQYYPMSSAQKRMYIEQQMRLDSVSYNMPAILILEGEISYERLKGAFQQLIERHESLRTIFVAVKGEGMQIIREHVDFNIEYWESKEENSREIAANFPGPFDLSKAPLLRAGLLKINDAKHLFMIDMHHIISDGVSHQILAKDFSALYNGETLPPLELQYKDFSEWQNRLFETDFIKKQEEYWLNRFKDNVPILHLPTDYPRPSGNISNKGNSIDFYVEGDVCAKLYEIVKKTGITVYTFLLAAYNILLSKFTGQTDILVVSPITGRRHNDLENIIGMFVNMLVMRNRPEGEKTFGDFLGEVQTNLLDAYENQEYQFPELTNRLNLQGHMHKNPLLNTVFTMQNIDIKKIDLIPSTPYNSLKIALYKYDRKISVFDLHLIASEDESDGRIDLSIEYAVELFKESTIRDISKHYLEIIEKVIENPGIMIKDIRFSSHLLALKQKEFTDGKDFGF